MSTTGNGAMPGGFVQSRTRAIAYVALSVAFIAISAWVVVPIGPIPFTLQMLVIPLLICLLPTKWMIAAIWAYVLVGVLGVPVFSGVRGGIGVLLGPTGGFLVAYLVAVPAAALFLASMRKSLKSKPALVGCEIIAGLLFTVIAYIGGWLQYSVVAGIGLEAAFFAAVAPFVVPDIVKVLLAVAVAQPLHKVVGP